MTNPKTLIIYQCNYYDDVFGSLSDFPIPTSQTRNKISKKAFRQKIYRMLEGRDKKSWPYTERLTVTIGVSGPESYIKRVDLDNLLKYLIDILKGRVFLDDKQIYSIMSSKQELEQHGFLVGIRRLKENEFNHCIPPLFGENIELKIIDGRTKMWRAFESK